MNWRSVTLLLFLITSFTILAQEGPRLSGFSIGYGYGNTPGEARPFDEKYKEWQQFEGNFANELSKFSSPSIIGNPNTYHSIAIQAHFNWNKQQMGINPKNHALSIGLSFADNASVSYYIGRSQEFSLDTFHTDDGPIYKDSAYAETMKINELANGVTLDIRYEANTNPANRFHFYLAPTLSLGLNYDRGISATLDQYSSIKYSLHTKDNVIGADGSPVKQDKQFEALPMQYDATLYLPIGVRCRFSKKDNWLGKVFFFAEGRLGLNYRMEQQAKNDLNSQTALFTGIRIWEFPFKED